MSAIRLARTELRRITSGVLPRLAVLALVLVPLLYGSLYLYANADPYDRLDHIPAALVVQDTGTTAADGTRTDAGRGVADRLRESGAFAWHEVDAAEAEDGVRAGRYTFSLTLPADFSRALTSAAGESPRQGLILVTTNDANNYLVGTIADRVVAEVRRSVAAEVGTAAAEKFLVGFGTIYDRTREAADGATRLADGATKASSGAGELATGQRALLDGARSLADGAAKAADGAATLSTGLSTLRDKTAELPGQTRALADGAAQVAAGNEKVASAGEAVAEAAEGLAGGLDEVDARVETRLREAGVPEDVIAQTMTELRTLRAPLDKANERVQTASGDLRRLSDGADKVAKGADTLADATPALAKGIATAADGGGALAEGTAALRDGAATLRDGERSALDGTLRLADGAKQVSAGAVKLRDGLTAGLGEIPHPDAADRDRTAQTIGDPVAVRTVGENAAGSYGAGLAPFFLGLATWIGAFVLFLLVRPLSSRALAAGHGAVRTALGGWLPAALLGLAQVVVMFGVVRLLVDFQRPAGALLFLMLTTLAFTAIVHALNALLGAVGKFVALVVLILQLISAGGTFPWQTLPEVLYPLHAVLPMGYVVDGLRHLIYGGSLSGLGLDVLVLGCYLIGGLVVSTVAARRQRVWTAARLRPELVL
ncbi:YhgE/Pip family protein [Actinokineospora guangxiensis]|uniref:YhgE/Pip family protein n=1 Tax=Actinokineospora guangxiensis TaxID=1490288 RepID=A0ABW0EKE0_9PSEU